MSRRLSPVRAARSSAALAALSCIGLGAAGCPLLPGPEDLEKITAQVIVTGARNSDELVVQVEDITKRAQVDGEPVVTFNLVLPAGVHLGRLTVISKNGGGLPEPRRCAGFALVIPAGADGVADAVSLHVPSMPRCDEEPPCIVGLPCDDGIACTKGDVCLPPGICVGAYHPDDGACGACEAVTCGETCSECCQPARNICEDTCGTCLMTCGGQPCTCRDAVCSQTPQPQEAMHAVCDDGAVCNTVADGASSILFECTDDSSCTLTGRELEVAQISCVESLCTIALKESRNVTTACRAGAACALHLDTVVSASLTCLDSTCGLSCEGGTDCALSCGGRSVCAVACSEDDTCELACGAEAAACELSCGESSATTCRPGERCACTPD
jgi:hypothetical protein